MLRFLLCLALLFLSVTLLKADAPQVPASELYATATRHLREGQVFQTAINDLQKAVSQDPKNGSYHIALGCADADRAASLAYAAQWTKTLNDDQVKYPKELADWEAAQRDPKSDDYGSARPTPPPDDLFFRTKDDGRLFRLTETQSATQIKTLSQAATQEWSLALSLAKTSAEKAAAEYIQGWGLQLLVSATSDTAKPLTDTDGQTSKPKLGDVGKLFETATKDAPDNAVYWQSLGDVRHDLKAQSDNDAEPEAEPSILTAYRQSLKLKPGNASLWYRIFDMLQKSDPDEAEKALTQAARYDSGNAYPQYQLAALEFKKTKYDTRPDSYGSQDEVQQKVEAARPSMQESQSRTAGENAISDMERGNAAAMFRNPAYDAPIPPMMKIAWDYWKFERELFVGYAGLRELARSAVGYADFLVWEKNFSGAERAARASIGAGYKMIGDWPVKDETPGDGSILNSLVGIAVAAIGYRELTQIGQASGDPVMAEQTKSEEAAFRQQTDIYRKAIQANLATDTIYDDY